MERKTGSDAGHLMAVRLGKHRGPHELLELLLLSPSLFFVIVTIHHWGFAVLSKRLVGLLFFFFQRETKRKAWQHLNFPPVRYRHDRSQGLERAKTDSL